MNEIKIQRNTAPKQKPVSYTHLFTGQEFDFGEMASYLEREIGKIVYTK